MNRLSRVELPQVWRFAILALSGFALAAALPAVEDALTTAASVHRLDSSAIEKSPEVRLEGTVTHHNHKLGDGFFLQDETDGIYVMIRKVPAKVRPGDRVRVRGVAGPGAFAPVVILTGLDHLGKGQMPEAIELTAEELATGSYDSRLVRVRGTVRATQVADGGALLPGEEGHLALQLRTGGRTIVVGINEFKQESLHLTGAEVVVKGIAAGVFSHTRQLLSPVLLLDTDDELSVVRPPRSFENAPRKTSNELLGYSPEGGSESRVVVAGKLIGQTPGRWLALKDEKGALFVELSQEVDLQPGDELEVFGFPEMREQTLWLMNSLVRRLGPGDPPKARVGTVGDGLKNPSELWQLEGEVQSPPRPGEHSWVLSLKSGDSEFEALLPKIEGDYPSAWREGARLAVTGISQPFFLPGQRVQMLPLPQGLRLHVGSLEAIEVLASGPWWNAPGIAKSIGFILMGVSLVLAVVLGVVFLLARKNQALEAARSQLAFAQSQLARRFSARTGEWQQELAARHAAEADFALLTAERTRLARELHDTIEQSIASAALHLDAAKAYFQNKPEESERLLVEATQHLRDSQAEVRRSVWGLRSVKLENTTLPDALEQLSLALSDAQGLKVKFTQKGEPYEISPGAASQFFRVAQEGVTNALKHSEASQIEITLDFRQDVLFLMIQDDGKGFDVDKAERQGHYGLRGMQERAASLGGELEIVSAEGEGSRIMFRATRSKLKGKKNYATI